MRKLWNFQRLFMIIKPLLSRSDARIRSLTSSGVFSVSSFFALVFRPSFSSFPHRISGFPFPLPKSKGSFGKIAWDQGPTLDFIQSFYPQISMLSNFRLYVFQLPRQMSIYFYIALLVGGCGVNFSAGNISFAVPATMIDLFSSWRSSIPARPRGNCGSCVCMPLYGKFERT